jgi:hypothetical protein
VVSAPVEIFARIPINFLSFKLIQFRKLFSFLH